MPKVQSLMNGFPPPEEARVTWSNLGNPPFNRWSYRHMEQLRPAITIRSGSTTPRELPCNFDTLGAFSFDSVMGRPVGLEEHLKASYTDAFIVLKQGEVLYERYFDGNAGDDRHLMFSVTKSLIGLLAEGLVLDGRLNPKQFVRDYLPQLNDSAFGDATIRHLLDMAVGINFKENYEDPHSEIAQFAFASGLLPPPPSLDCYESLYAFLPTLSKRGDHGSHFHYVTAVTEVLGWVMEVVAGQSCAAMLESVWLQLGCDRDAFILCDPLGKAIAGGGFNATARDMARFGQMLLDGGRACGNQVIPESVIQTIARGSDPSIFAANQIYAEWAPGASYKSQWYIFQQPSKAIMAVGVHGQYLYVDFDARVVAVKQSSLPVAESPIDVDSVRLLRALGKTHQR